MRRGASVAALALVLAGCGGANREGQRSLDAFLGSTDAARFANRFPHRPGSIPCTARDPAAKRRVAATCSTDLSLRSNHDVIVTFTVSWSHGSRARTWFVFLRRDGTLKRVQREGSSR
ncbi:MAG TPA: hypothetical protein VFJ77_02405 [Gaiellaceae bacterium]|nr:hypothetical protein [Gaiellaceae bacterium]